MKATHGNIDAVSRIRQLSIFCTGHQNSALHVTMVALNFVPRMTMVATLPDDGWIELHAGWNGFGQGCIGWRRLSNCKLLSVYRWSLRGCIEYWIIKIMIHIYRGFIHFMLINQYVYFVFNHHTQYGKCSYFLYCFMIFSLIHLLVLIS